MNRRTFLAASAVGMASMNAFGAPSNRVRVGLMGAGGRGKELSKVYSGIPGVEISVIADVDENRAKDVAGLVEKAAGKAPRTETDFRKILDDKNVDVF
ncbi:MAG: gfo/Idh/MocA family oxidoreductase, partial [Gemmataceae bacterium]